MLELLSRGSQRSANPTSGASRPLIQAFNQPIGGWDTSSVTDMSYMFRTLRTFNQPIGTVSTLGAGNMW